MVEQAGWSRLPETELIERIRIMAAFLMIFFQDGNRHRYIVFSSSEIPQMPNAINQMAIEAQNDCQEAA